jgi:hypothetical protein
MDCNQDVDSRVFVAEIESKALTHGRWADALGTFLYLRLPDTLGHVFKFLKFKEFLYGFEKRGGTKL